MWTKMGLLLLSSRVFDSRSRACGLKPLQRHCIVFEQDTLSSALLLNTGSTQEELKQMAQV